MISISVIEKWSKHSGPTYILSIYLYWNQEIQNTAYVISQESEIGSLTYRFHTYWELQTGFSGNSWNFTTHLDTIRLRQARPENLIRKNKIAKFLQVLKHLKVNGRCIFLWKHRLNILWCPIKMRVFHQNESFLPWPHPPSSYVGRREQVGSSHFDRTPQ